MDCSFCNESDFDDIGLKTHLLSYCEKFKQTHTAPVFFPQSLQDSFEELIDRFCINHKGYVVAKENGFDNLLKEFIVKVRAL